MDCTSTPPAGQAGYILELAPRCQLVLAALVTLCDGSGQTMATGQQLRDKTTLSNSVVGKALAELEAAGYLTRERRGRRRIVLTALATAAAGGC